VKTKLNCNPERRYPLMRHLFLLIFLLSIIASGIYAAGAMASDEHNLLILYSNDVIGETEPCG
jgi:hypothetical protein